MNTDQEAFANQCERLESDFVATIRACEYTDEQIAAVLIKLLAFMVMNQPNQDEMAQKVIKLFLNEVKEQSTFRETGMKK